MVRADPRRQDQLVPIGYANTKIMRPLGSAQGTIIRMGYGMKLNGLLTDLTATNGYSRFPNFNSALFHPLSRFTKKSFQRDPRDPCVSDSNGQLFLDPSTFFYLSLFASYVPDSDNKTYRKQVRPDSRLLTVTVESRLRF